MCLGFISERELHRTGLLYMAALLLRALMSGLLTKQCPSCLA